MYIPVNNKEELISRFFVLLFAYTMSYLNTVNRFRFYNGGTRRIANICKIWVSDFEGEPKLNNLLNILNVAKSRGLEIIQNSTLLLFREKLLEGKRTLFNIHLFSSKCS